MKWERIAVTVGLIVCVFSGAMWLLSGHLKELLQVLANSHPDPTVATGFSAKLHAIIQYLQQGLSEENVKYFADVSAILSTLGSGFGLMGRRRLSEALARTPAVDATWYWVSVVRQAARVPEYGRILRVTTGKLKIEDIDSYKQRAEYPHLVIAGEISDSIGDGEFAQEDLKATDIYIGRRSAERFTYEWKGKDGGREGISIISYEPPNQGKFLWFRWDKPIEKMTGRFYSTQTLNSGHSRYWRNQADAKAEFNVLRAELTGQQQQ